MGNGTGFEIGPIARALGSGRITYTASELDRPDLVRKAKELVADEPDRVGDIVHIDSWLVRWGDDVERQLPVLIAQEKRFAAGLLRNFDGIQANLRDMEPGMFYVLTEALLDYISTMPDDQHIVSVLKMYATRGIWFSEMIARDMLTASMPGKGADTAPSA